MIERQIWRMETAGSEISCSGWIIYAGLFSPPHANAVEASLPEAERGAPIFQLINFIFTHLFLNALSDGNAAGCGSEVLTWQAGLKGEASRCQRQVFLNSKFKGQGCFFYFLMRELAWRS